MAKTRTKEDPGPFSLRLSREMRAALEAWASDEMRSLHSLILVVLRDALAARLQAQLKSGSAVSDDQTQPKQ